MSILEKIDKPEDLHLIKAKFLPQLAKELREEILKYAPKEGISQAGSLGAVELTIALHSVFQAPEDKIIWDTGHQTYAHKLLTGRRDRFKTIRQYNGLSGYPSREESPYDAFGGGHTSSALPAAVGMVVARDQQGKNHAVVAVIGDGTLTSGVTFEALQNAGHIKTGLIVVLNDNEMFLSHRAAALGTFLSKVLTLGLVTKAEKKIEKFLQRLHFLGTLPLRVARRFKVLLFPGMLFEEMGFRYLGPVEGHDIGKLQEILSQVKDTKQPVLLHVITKKWKKEETTAVSGPTGELSYSQVLGKTLLHLAHENKALVAVTPAVSQETGLEEMAKDFPERVFHVGIAEQHALTFAAGLACEGFRPVVSLSSSFLQRAMDNAFHEIALQHLPVVLAIDGAGVMGEEGPSHHGVFDLAFLRMIPGMTIMAPASENELQHMLHTALTLPGPSAIRYPHRITSGYPLLSNFQTLPLGKAQVLKEGADVTILALGPLVAHALQAAHLLQADGIRCGVVNMRFVKPLDTAFLKKLSSSTKMILTCEDHAASGGLGSCVQEALEGHDFPVHVLGFPDRFIEQGPVEFLYEKYGLSVEKMINTIKELVQKAVGV